MASKVICLALLVCCRAVCAWTGPPVSRRAALALASAGASAVLRPAPAAARSKEKAKEKALSKATAAEQRQAVKEYKTAPRPEIVFDERTGKYNFVEGTVKAGSSGDLAACAERLSHFLVRPQASRSPPPLPAQTTSKRAPTSRQPTRRTRRGLVGRARPKLKPSQQRRTGASRRRSHRRQGRSPRTS